MQVFVAAVQLLPDGTALVDGRDVGRGPGDSGSAGVPAQPGRASYLRRGGARVPPRSASLRRPACRYRRPRRRAPRQAYVSLASLAGWLGSPRVAGVLDSGAVGPRFKSQPRRCRVTVLGKLFTPVVPLFTKQRNW